MWTLAKKDPNGLGSVARNVKELKEILNSIPDDYSLSVIGDTFSVLVEADEKFILIDEISELENILEEQENDPEIENE